MMKTILSRLHSVYWLIAVLAVVFPLVSSAEVNVTVTPDHTDWQYAIAEPIIFTISAQKDGEPVMDADVSWEIGPEKMEPFAKGSSSLKEGKLTLHSPGMNRPGFLRCTARLSLDGQVYSGLATGGYEPLRIEPTTPMPDDFQTYWSGEIARLKEVPLDPILEPVEDISSDQYEAFHVSFTCGPEAWRGAPRIYGMLSVPKGEGPFPALLQVPGAGVRPYRPSSFWPEQGVIHLTIGIHGIPVNLPDQLYTDLGTGALSNYYKANLDNRDRYYYHRVFLGCVRAVDFLFTLKQFDGETLGIHGGSQGGALSIITAGLDKRIKFLVSTFPAMCDHYGYLHDRAGGWPHLFQNLNLDYCTPDKIETAAYYDVVNFARILEVPVLMGLGYNDQTCPPTSMFSAYNAIPSPKKIQIIPRMGHGTLPEHSEHANAWLLEHLKPSN